MSLISDALKKAHVETAQQDRRQHREYMNHGGRAAVAPSVSHGTVVLAAVVGGCVTAGAGLLFLTRTVRAPVPSRGVAVVEASQPAAAASPAPVVKVERSQAAVREPAPRPARRPAVARPATEAPLELQTPRDVERVVDRVAEPKALVESAPPAPPRRVSRDNFVAGRTYSSPLQGPLGSELVLTGISSVRGGDPVAIINGGVVRAGAIVGPFAIEAIEESRVRVRYVDVSFWLSY